MSDALVEAEGLLDQLPEAVSRRALGERLGRAIVELRSSDHQIQRIKALIEIAQLTGFGNRTDQGEVLSEMIECAKTVGRALEDADDAETLRIAVYDYGKDLIQAIGALDRSIREHWRTVAHERFQPLLGIGELLTAMNVPNNLGGRLIDCGKRGMSVINASSAPDLQTSIAALLREHGKLQVERAAEIGEGEVAEFINGLADKRATLAMVTPKVREWLVNHAALDRVGITTR